MAEHPNASFIRRGYSALGAGDVGNVQKTSLRRTFTILVAVAALALTGFSSAAEANSTTKRVRGRIYIQQVTEGCTSALGLCTAGRAVGSINGAFEFVADRFAPSDTPTVQFFTGRSVVRTRTGDIRCADSGSLDVVSTDGQFVDLCTVVGGTGRWTNASGWVQIVGTFTAASGGESDYNGKITTP